MEECSLLSSGKKPPFDPAGHTLKPYAFQQGEVRGKRAPQGYWQMFASVLFNGSGWKPTQSSLCSDMAVEGSSLTLPQRWAGVPSDLADWNRGDY